jgi:hypothetical protein
VRQHSERAFSHARRAGGAEDRVEGLLKPEHPLGEVDGITVVVMLVELWTSRLVVQDLMRRSIFGPKGRRLW